MRFRFRSRFGLASQEILVQSLQTHRLVNHSAFQSVLAMTQQKPRILREFLDELAHLDPNNLLRTQIEEVVVVRRERFVGKKTSHDGDEESLEGEVSGGLNADVFLLIGGQTDPARNVRSAVKIVGS